ISVRGPDGEGYVCVTPDRLARGWDGNEREVPVPEALIEGSLTCWLARRPWHPLRIRDERSFTRLGFTHPPRDVDLEKVGGIDTGKRCLLGLGASYGDPQGPADVLFRLVRHSKARPFLRPHEDLLKIVATCCEPLYQDWCLVNQFPHREETT